MIKAEQKKVIAIYADKGQDKGDTGNDNKAGVSFACVMCDEIFHNFSLFLYQLTLIIIQEC